MGNGIGHRKTTRKRERKSARWMGEVPEIRSNQGHRLQVAEGIAIALLEGPAVYRSKTPHGYRCHDGTEVKHVVKMALAKRGLVRAGLGADPAQPAVRCVCLTDAGRELAQRIVKRKQDEATAAAAVSATEEAKA